MSGWSIDATVVVTPHGLCEETKCPMILRRDGSGAADVQLSSDQPGYGKPQVSVQYDNRNWGSTLVMMRGQMASDHSGQPPS